MKRIPSLIRQRRRKWTPRFDEAVTYCLHCRKFYVGIGKTTSTTCNRLRGRIGALCCIERTDWNIINFKAVRRWKNKRRRVSYDRKIIEGLNMKIVNKKRIRILPVLNSEDSYDFLRDDNYCECKKLFVSPFTRFLKGERCPLSPDDRNCEFHLERSMEKWNKM